MKYGRWKREAKRLQAEYRDKSAHLFLQPGTFILPGEDLSSDASRPIQQAVDFAAMGMGGTVFLKEGTYPITRTISGPGFSAPNAVILQAEPPQEGE